MTWETVHTHCCTVAISEEYKIKESLNLMNFSKIIFLGTLLGTAPLWAGLSINDSGSFTVGDLRARFKCAAGTQWKSAIQDDLRYFTVVKKEGGTLESKLDMSPELKGVLRQSFRKTGVATWVNDL